MTSTPQHTVATIQLSGYTALASLAAVGYDYILTFSDEIDYVWNRPWTRVSTLFVLARYFGLYSVIVGALCKILVYSGEWAFVIFIGAANLVMILRVWAMYNQSKIVLSALLTLYTIGLILNLVDCILLTQMNEVVIKWAFDFSVCEFQRGIPLWLVNVTDALQIALGALMFLLVVVRFVRDSFQMYQATKRFELNRYTNLLTRDGIFHFLVILSYSLLCGLTATANIGLEDQWWAVLTGTMEYVPAFTFTRLILSLRKLYAQDLRDRRGRDIDTAFSLTSTSSHDVAGGAIVLVDTTNRQNDGEEQGGEQDEEIQ